MNLPRTNSTDSSEDKLRDLPTHDSPRPNRPGVSVRARIVAGMAAMLAAALAVSGVLLYVVQSRTLNQQIAQSVDQEFAEFAAMSRSGVDPTTGEAFADPGSLIELFLSRNVPDRGELLVGWWDGGARVRSSSDELTRDPGFVTAVRRHLDIGGTEEIEVLNRGRVMISVQPVTVHGESGALVVARFVDPLRAPLNQTMRTYTIVASIAWLILVAVALTQSGRLLRPLRTLRETAQEITETDLSLRIPETGNDDITALTRTLNDMLLRLDSAFQGQRQFLDDAGHELRTPLTVLQGHLELCDPNDPADVAQTHELLLDEVERMGRLVSDLIMLAKSESPDFARLDELDLEQLMGSVHAKARGFMDRDWQIAEVLRGTVRGDQQRLTQAMLQLCGNAVRHTSSSGVIRLGTSPGAPGRVQIWVADDGPGVPEPDRLRIFERFVRLAPAPGVSHQAGDDRDHGFGLGLSLVASIAEAHSGRAFVTDDNDLSGARFVLDLPLIERSQPWPVS